MDRFTMHPEKHDPETVICRSCGAEYDSRVPNCPYCGTMNLPAAETAYMGKLETMRGELEKLGDFPGREAGRRMKTLRKKFLIASAVVAVGLLIAFLVFARQNRLDAEQRKAEYLWQREAFREMDRLYAEKDYDALLSFYESAGIEGHQVWNYAHSAFCEYLELLAYARNTRREVEEGYADSWVLLRDELMLYRLERMESLSTEERLLLDEMREPLLEDLQSRFHLTEEERNAFRKTLEREGYLSYSECEDFLKERGTGS